VRLDEPAWWYGGRADLRQRALIPVARLYGWIAERRYHQEMPYRSRLPIICVGNFTAGGTGKTPLSIHIARLLIARGEKPVFLTRGYGGRVTGPAWVDTATSAARRFGDEPMLLAAVAPTLVARDRRAGIIAVERDARSPSVVIMDDGLQNPAVAKDLSIALVDGKRGVGNGEVIPAGPLRAPLEFQLGLVDAIIVRDPPDNGSSGSVLGVLRKGFPGPVLAASVAPAGNTSWVSEKPLVAFAGIANPRRFYRLLERLGGRVAEQKSYPDHHWFSASDAERLLDMAHRTGGQLVTTEKDYARLDGNPALDALAAQTRVLPIEMQVEDRDVARLNSLIEAALKGVARRNRPPPA
jgi:tetraacyldisaccharide 4'-kinase